MHSLKIVSELNQKEQTVLPKSKSKIETSVVSSCITLISSLPLSQTPKLRSTSAPSPELLPGVSVCTGMNMNELLRGKGKKKKGKSAKPAYG